MSIPRFFRQRLMAMISMILAAGAAQGASDIAGPAIITDDQIASLILNSTAGGVLTPYQWALNGSSSYCEIQDVIGGKSPFKILPDTSTDTLCLFQDRVGIGTSSPEESLHVVGGTIRLGAGGQRWNVFSDNTGFGVFDVGFSKLPFKVKLAAPDNSLFVNTNGDIGLGTSTPAAGLHLVKTAQESTAEIIARFVTSDDSVGSLAIQNNSAGNGVFIPKIVGRSASQNAALITEAVITQDLGASPAIAYNAVKGAGGALTTRPLVVYRNNSVAKVTIAANGAITATSFNPVSSRALKHDIKELKSQQASDALGQLNPVEFVYNDDESQKKRIGFIAEDVPDLVADADRQSVPIMDVVAVLTRVVKDQQHTIEQQRKRLDDQERHQQQTIATLQKRLEALEKRPQ